MLKRHGRKPRAKTKPPVRFAFDREKAVAVIAYLASKPKEVTELDKYKAAKLIFLADKYHLVRFGRPIVGAEYKALPLGPVPQEPLHMINGLLGVGIPNAAKPLADALGKAVEVVEHNLANPRLRARGPVKLDELSRSDVAALDHVIKLHGKKSFGELKALTHEMYAYKVVWERRPKNVDAVPMRYEDFFEEDTDAIRGAFEAMLENGSFTPPH